MNLYNSIEDSDEEDEEFPPLPSDIETLTYDNRHNSIDLFYCPSPSFPTPPPMHNDRFFNLVSPEQTLLRTYANVRTFTSKRSSDLTIPAQISFATQFKKKSRPPIVSFLETTYVNIPPSSEKIKSTPTEVTYATLMNTTSLMPLSNSSDHLNNHAEYQELHIASSKNEDEVVAGVYENVKVRRPPPIPTESLKSPKLENSPSPEEISVSIIDTEHMKNDSSHIYMNLKMSDDSAPTLPSRLNKSLGTEHSRSPSPPLIPPRQCSTNHNSSSKSDNSHPCSPETTCNTTSDSIKKQIELNMTPNCSDKSDLYRQKMSIPLTDHLPPVANPRQRRTLHSIRRRRLRGSTALRGSIRAMTSGYSNRTQSARSNSNISVRHPMVTDDRWRRTLRKRRRQRVLQMKLDGNVLQSRNKMNRPISDHTYNEIRQSNSARAREPIEPSANRVLERAMQFNGALRDRVFSWYRGANQQATTTNKLTSTSENEESDQKYVTTHEEDEDEEDEEEEEEEEFFTHNTFEDFLLRRRPKSSASTTISGTSTVLSHLDSASHRLPTRSNSHHPIQIPPLPPIPPPPLPSSPPPVRRFPGLALGLDKTDVDFIHNILQRTRGENRVWNRITALKEAYIRATKKKADLPKKSKVVPTNGSSMDDKKKKKKALAMKHSLAATKIRAELEKYDELPGSSATMRDEDDDYYDETCSIDPDSHHHQHRPSHHRSIPSLFTHPSTTAHRFISFVTSIKRRAQNNVQQFQKNLQEIRSRIQTEAMEIPIQTSNIQRHSSFTVRPKPMTKDSPNGRVKRAVTIRSTANDNPVVHRSHSHHSMVSIEPKLPVHRYPLNRTQSNSSHAPITQRPLTRFHSRVLPIETKPSVMIRSPSLVHHPSAKAFERQPSHQRRTKRP